MSPVGALRYCAEPGCPQRVTRGRCTAHRLDQEARRVNQTVRRWYRTARWRQLRETLFAEQPLCVRCQQAGRVELWTDLDHIRPHRGDPALFWDRRNLQGLCKACHTAKTSRGA